MSLVDEWRKDTDTWVSDKEIADLKVLADWIAENYEIKRKEPPKPPDKPTCCPHADKLSRIAGVGWSLEGYKNKTVFIDLKFCPWCGKELPK